MKAMQIARTGGPEVLTLVDIEAPNPRVGELLVKVDAASVNFADTVRRRGAFYPAPTRLPIVLGSEICGTVVSVGDGVTGWQPGSRLIGLLDHGGYAEYVIVEARSAISIPEDTDSSIAAAIFVQGMTALLVLDDVGGPVTGRNVLVEGAAGGVGGLAVQIARLLGARHVIGAVSSPDKGELARELGATGTVNYTEPGWEEAARALTNNEGFDLILHVQGGEALARELALLRPSGRIVAYGAASNEPMLVDAAHMLGGNLGVCGFYLGAHLADAERMKRQFSRLMGWVESGRITVPIGGCFPLAEAARAHALLESRQSTGKLILKP